MGHQQPKEHHYVKKSTKELIRIYSVDTIKNNSRGANKQTMVYAIPKIWETLR